MCPLKFTVPSQSGESNQQQIRVEAGDSLAGERTHGLPNITNGNTSTKHKKNEKDKSVWWLYGCYKSQYYFSQFHN